MIRLTLDTCHCVFIYDPKNIVNTIRWENEDSKCDLHKNDSTIQRANDYNIAHKFDTEDSKLKRKRATSKDPKVRLEILRTDNIPDEEQTKEISFWFKLKSKFGF